MKLWEDMTEQERYDTLAAMCDYGGHFAGNLGKAWMYADSHNSNRLAAAFPDLIEHFSSPHWRTLCANAQ